MNSVIVFSSSIFNSGPFETDSKKKLTKQERRKLRKLKKLGKGTSLSDILLKTTTELPTDREEESSGDTMHSILTLNHQYKIIVSGRNSKIEW